MKPNFILFILMALLLNPLRAFSQVEDLLDMSLEELMQIEITGVSRYKQLSDKAPNSVMVITKQQIKDRGYEYLSDVLKDIPGFDVVDNASRFGEFITFRGVQGNERFLVLVEGRKINPPTGTFISLGNSLSIKFAKQIEIIFGPASAVYGADAFAGIINIIPEQSEEKLAVSAETGLGSLNSFDAHVGVQYKVSDDISLMFDANLFTSDGPDFAGRNAIYDVFSSYPAAYKADARYPISDHNLYLSAKVKQFNVGYYRKYFNESNATGMNPAMYIHAPENVWKTATNLAWLGYKHETKSSGTFNFDLSFINNSLSNESQFLKWKVPGVYTDIFNQYMTGTDNAIKATFFYNHNFTEKLKFVTGIDFENTTSIPPYANDEILGNSFKYEGADKQKIDDALTVTENRLGWFGQATYSPFKYLEMVIGGRYDYSSRYEGTFNPRMGLVVTPTSSTTWRLIYGTAFQAPSLFYKYEQFGTGTVVMLSESEVQKLPGNAHWKIKNQKVQTYETSITQQLGKNARLTASVYYNNMHDMIERATFTTSVNNKYFNKLTPGIRNENIGKQNVFGLNGQADVKLIDKLLAYCYYSYTDGQSEVNNVVTNIPRISKHKVWLGATYQNLFDAVTLNTRLRWASKINNINPLVAPVGVQPAYFTLDVNLISKKLFNFVVVNAIFENILNNEYEHGGLFNQAGVYTATIPQEGFRFRVGVEVEF